MHHFRSPAVMCSVAVNDLRGEEDDCSSSSEDYYGDGDGEW